ncbi:MAG: SMP-30/gluconolactonase/LRE family protein [Pirellulales bacterium]
MAAWTEAEVLFDSDRSELRFLPEGPYSLGEGRFSWVAIQHGPTSKVGSLNIFDTRDVSNQTYELPGRPGFARPTTDANKYLVGAERELGIFDIQSGAWQPFVRDVDQDVSNTIINDATTFGDNIVFGTKDLEFKTKKAGLYLYRGSDGRLVRLRNDQICSNGKAIVADSSGALSLYDIDSPTRKIVRYALDIAAGTLSDPMLAVDLANAAGVPDGMTLTPDGKSAIVSLYNPDDAEFGLTQQFNLKSGEVEHSWRTAKSPQNTCPLLMQSADGSVKLIITTAVEFMPAERQHRAVNAGALFIAETSIKSVAAAERFPLSAVKM